MAQPKKVSSRNKWLASGSLIKGKVIIDQGAVQALLQRKSLLLVGVKDVVQPFEAGEVFQVFDETENIVAVAKSKWDAGDLIDKENRTDIVLAHADDIVLL
ncbi:Glutamate 5-kinase [compost metagenome]